MPLTFQLWLSPVCLSASAGDGPVHSPLALLLNSLSPLFCKWAQQCLRLKLFVGKFSFSFSLSLFFSLSLGIPQFGLLSHVSSLSLSSVHSGPVLTLSNAARASLFSPHLLVADRSLCATSLLGVVVRHVICGVSFIYFFLPVMLPSEIPKLPTDPPVRGFPGVWKLFPFHNSLPGTGLCPSLFCLSFYFLYFVLPPFKDNGLSL